MADGESRPFGLPDGRKGMVPPSAAPAVAQFVQWEVHGFAPERTAFGTGRAGFLRAARV